MTGRARPTVLLVGGGGGLVGRAIVAELASDYRIRSVHRHESPLEASHGVEWIRGDVLGEIDWVPLLRDVDVVLNVAGYRAGHDRRFRQLYEGLGVLLEAARGAEIDRFLQISVPKAPEPLEASLPYLTYRRRFDRQISASGLSYALLKPTALFAPGDKLLGVLLRLAYRTSVLPMFGAGDYHLSPISTGDLARIVHTFAGSRLTGSFDLGGPVRYTYGELAGLLFRSLGKQPRYWRLSPSGSVRLARVLEGVGSTLLYAYEVEWLLSDLLGLPAFTGLDRPLERVEPYLDAETRRLRGGREPSASRLAPDG